MEKSRPFVYSTKINNTEYLPIYIISEYLYCQRSAWLHLFKEEPRDIPTLEYQKSIDEHRATDKKTTRFRKANIKETTSTELFHNELFLIGKADIIRWENDLPVPVETKPGKARDFPNLKMQAILQALCLEKMTGKPVKKCELFFRDDKQKIIFEINDNLKNYAINLVKEFREKLKIGISAFKKASDNRCKLCIFKFNCHPEEYFYE